MNKSIIVDIDENGNCNVSGKNFIGTDCDKFIKEITELLGNTLVSKKLPEYNQRVIQNNRQKVGR